MKEIELQFIPKADGYYDVVIPRPFPCQFPTAGGIIVGWYKHKADNPWLVTYNTKPRLMAQVAGPEEDVHAWYRAMVELDREYWLSKIKTRYFGVAYGQGA